MSCPLVCLPSLPMSDAMRALDPPRAPSSHKEGPRADKFTLYTLSDTKLLLSPLVKKNFARGFDQRVPARLA